jgi:hypothetical protein
VDEIDKVLSVVCAGGLGVVSLAGLLLWRFTSHYLPRGAVAMDTLTPGTPTTIEFPSGGALDLMLRYTTERRRGQSIAVTALIEIERTAPAGNGNVMAARYALGLSPQAPKPQNLPFQRIESVSYAVKQAGRASTRTVPITTIPSGKPGRVTMDLLVSANTNVTYVAFFVKNARKGLFV